MRKSSTVLDRVVLLCRDVEKTSAIYCESLGLKVVLQSPQLVQLKDSNDFRLFLKAYTKPYQLLKGYSPILSFRVEMFDQVRDKLRRCQLIQDGEVVETELGKLVNFVGPEGEHISINNFVIESEENQQQKQQSKSEKEIKNLLSKIKL